MSHYRHLTIEEREKLYLLFNQGVSIRKIAAALNRSPSTISRELERNTLFWQPYSPSVAQIRYKNRRKRCGKKRILANAEIKEKVRTLIQDRRWSPEQVEFRLKLENSPNHISYATIYRAISSGIFDIKKKYLKKNERFSFYLRRKGKKRRKNGAEHRQGKYAIPFTISQRPKEAEDRSVLGYWEADTVAGTKGSASVLTLTERKSRFLLACKIDQHTADVVSNAIICLLDGIAAENIKGITPDRGSEFAMHEEVTKTIHNVPFYFADPYSPWQRGTNENTNGLLRECIPKGKDIAPVDPEVITAFVNCLNHRPRKCLGWRSPFEVFFDKVLHLT